MGDRRSRKFVAGTLALGIVATACGGDDETAGTAIATSIASADPTTPETDPTSPPTQPTAPPVTGPTTTPTITPTTPPTSALADPTTTDPTTTVGLPPQTIAVVDLGGRQLALDGDTTIPTNQTLIVHDLAPTAPATGVDVTVDEVGPAGICESDADPAEIFLHGNAGDVCTVVLSTEETADHVATSRTVRIEFVPLANIGWTIESGPPGTGCFEPGDRLPDLVLRATAGTDSIFGVGVRSSYFLDADGTRTNSTFDRLDYRELETSDFTRLVIEFRIDPTVPAGSTIGVVIAFSSPGTGVSTSDEPDEFEWQIELSCP